MILGEVVDIVRYRAAHIEFGIVLEFFQDWPDQCRVGDECVKLFAPGESRANAFGAPTPDVFTGVSGQRGKGFECLVRMFFYERADREFCCETLRQFGHRVQRFIEVIGATVGDELSEWPQRKALVGLFTAVRSGWQTANENADGPWIRVGKDFGVPFANIVNYLLLLP